MCIRDRDKGDYAQDEGDIQHVQIGLKVAFDPGHKGPLSISMFRIYALNTGYYRVMPARLSSILAAKEPELRKSY